MFLDKLKEKRNRLKKFAHIFAGMVILIHSYERYEGGHSTYLFFALAGFVFLAVAIFHHQLQHKYPKIDSLFFLIEIIFPEPTSTSFLKIENFKFLEILPENNLQPMICLSFLSFQPFP